MKTTGWLLTLALPLAASESRVAAEHVVVYHEKGRFGGWPANHGIWSWGNEIVVGFRSAAFKVVPQGHAVDRDQPQEEYQARSLDGGWTWSIEKPPELKRPENGGPQPVDCPGEIDFTHPGFALMLRASGEDRASRFYVSTDRARTWNGPYKLRLFGQPRIMARTDYLVYGKRELMLFLTAAKRNDQEGRVFCARTRDGGKSWEFLAWLGPEPAGFSIMPSAVRLGRDEILTAIRRRENPPGGQQNWIETWWTKDGGVSWSLLNRPAPSTGGSSGNPPSMLKLRDGRLAITYGYRAVPYGIRARLSADKGHSWGDEIVLRAGGGNWDLGYPRTVQRPDGKLVTAYYFNDHADKERYIGATIWDPPALSLFSEAPRVVENVNVYKEPGRFGGWPANNGAWAWGDEILVGFSLGYFKRVESGHAIDGAKPNEPRFARSLDGGRTWAIEVPSFLDDNGKEKEPAEPPGGIDFTHPDFAMTLRMVNSRTGFSRFYYSYDRGKTWQGPYKLPTYDRKVISARTDYIVNGKRDAMALITAAKENGREGRVFATRTTDGGKTWKFVAWVGPEPPGFSIMPSTVRLGPKTLLTTLRQKEGERHWIDAYLSEDDGASWRYYNRPVESTGAFVGNPPSTIKLKDGRLALTYGYRSAPFGIRAKLSRDNGKTWSPEIMLRDDAGCGDLGYPRTVQRNDGKIVTLYYFNDDKYAERYIAATLWDPGTR